MWLARITGGVVRSVIRVDDFETDLVGTKEVRRPRQPRGWRIDKGAAAISQSPEGAVASARAVLAQPENGARARTTMAELMETMKGTA